MASQSEPFYNHHQRLHKKLTLALVASHIDSSGDDSINVLDLFCGCGERGIWYAKAFPKAYVVGIDRSATSIARALEMAAEYGVGDRCTFLLGEVGAVLAASSEHRRECDAQINSNASGGPHPSVAAAPCVPAHLMDEGFAVVEVDPFGCSLPWLPTLARNFTRPGGVICLNFTNYEQLSRSRSDSGCCSDRKELQLRRLLRRVVGCPSAPGLLLMCAWTYGHGARVIVLCQGADGRSASMVSRKRPRELECEAEEDCPCARMAPAALEQLAVKFCCRTPDPALWPGSCCNPLFVQTAIQLVTNLAELRRSGGAEVRTRTAADESALADILGASTPTDCADAGARTSEREELRSLLATLHRWLSEAEFHRPKQCWRLVDLHALWTVCEDRQRQCPARASLVNLLRGTDGPSSSPATEAVAADAYCVKTELSLEALSLLVRRFVADRGPGAVSGASGGTERTELVMDDDNMRVALLAEMKAATASRLAGLHATRAHPKVAKLLAGEWSAAAALQWMAAYLESIRIRTAAAGDLKDLKERPGDVNVAGEGGTAFEGGPAAAGSGPEVRRLAALRELCLVTAGQDSLPGVAVKISVLAADESAEFQPYCGPGLEVRLFVAAAARGLDMAEVWEQWQHAGLQLTPPGAMFHVIVVDPAVEVVWTNQGATSPPEHLFIIGGGYSQETEPVAVGGGGGGGGEDSRRACLLVRETIGVSSHAGQLVVLQHMRLAARTGRGGACPSCVEAHGSGSLVVLADCEISALSGQRSSGQRNGLCVSDSAAAVVLGSQIDGEKHGSKGIAAGVYCCGKARVTLGDVSISGTGAGGLVAVGGSQARLTYCTLSECRSGLYATTGAVVACDSCFIHSNRCCGMESFSQSSLSSWNTIVCHNQQGGVLCSGLQSRQRLRLCYVHDNILANISLRDSSRCVIDSCVLTKSRRACIYVLGQHTACSVLTRPPQCGSFIGDSGGKCFECSCGGVVCFIAS